MSLLPVFDKYFTKEDADYYFHLFETNNLHPHVDTPKETFDAIFGNTQVDLQYVLRLPANEFEIATQLLEEEIRKNDLPEDYYLYPMENDELYSILKNPKEWSRQDVIAARIILENRHYIINESQLLVDKDTHKQKEREKQKISIPVLVLFYLLSPLSALIPVVVGIIIYTIKDTDVDGKKDFVFSSSYRNHGLVITVIGLLSCIAWCYWLISL